MAHWLTKVCLLGTLPGLAAVSEVGAFTFTTSFRTSTATHGVATSSTSLDAQQHDTNRRFFAAAVATTALATLNNNPEQALAKSGDSASMKVPGVGSYIEYLIKKNEEQSGADESAMLYKGADLETQLRRLSDAANRLTEIRELAEDKKWSQVQGVITGPLGTLVQTMNTVTTASGGDKKVKDAATRVKGDVIAIGQAATKKSDEGCIEASDLAMKDLEAFVKIAFE